MVITARTEPTGPIGIMIRSLPLDSGAITRARATDPGLRVTAHYRVAVPTWTEPRPVAGAARTRTSTPEKDAALWASLVAAGLGITGVAVASHAHIGVGAAPFVGHYAWHVVVTSLLAPTVALVVVLAIRARVHERLSWPTLLLVGWTTNVVWCLALALVEGRHGIAGPLRGPHEYLVDVPSVDHDVHGVLENYVTHAHTYSPATRQHPPGPLLFLWALGRMGVHKPLYIGLVIIGVAALAVPLVAIAVRSLCHEPAGRRLVPVLALAPYAVWAAVSLDAVTATVCAAGVTCAVIGSEPRRSPWWAAVGGLLLGIGALFSYSAPWLATSVIAVYFVRRRALLNVVTGLAALVPLTVTSLAGFSYTAGLASARADFAERIGESRSWALWALLDLVVLLVAAGPTIVPAIRKIRRTPGWPFVVGAGLAVTFAVTTGISRGEVERSWLPFIPWLLVPAVAPERRPDRPGVVVAAATPLGLIGLGAAAAVVLEAALRSPW